MKKIHLFMPPRGKHGVMHHFTQKLYEALQRQGIEGELLISERENPEPFLKKLFEDKPDCTLSFNGLLPDKEGRFFCDMIKIPHIACLVDSPNQFFSLINSKYNIITSADRFACDFFRGLEYPNVFFMPHAVEKELTFDPSDERNYDVVMLSSCIDYISLRETWKKKHPALVVKALEEAAEKTLSDQETPYVTAFTEALDKQVRLAGGFDPSGLNYPDILDDLEIYIRGVDRVEIIKGIKNAHVHIFGSGKWEHYLGDHLDHVTIHEPVPYIEALEIMRKTKILLNSCLWIKNGAHERIFAGLATGALVLTSENPFMKEDFVDGENILFYQHNKWDDIDGKITPLLENESKRKEMAKKGREVTMEKHTWDHRAQSLIKYLKTHLQNKV